MISPDEVHIRDERAFLLDQNREITDASQVYLAKMAVDLSRSCLCFD